MRERSLLHLDPATGFYDRDRFLTEVLDLLSAQDPTLGAVLLVIEPDRVSKGQRPGLSILRGIAEIIRTTFRSSDIAARLPEGRFVVAVADTGTLSPQSLIARLYLALERYNSDRDKRSKIAFTVAGRRLSSEHRDFVSACLDELLTEIAGGLSEGPGLRP